MLVNTLNTSLSIIILRHFIFTILFQCLDLRLFMSHLCDLLFISSFIYIMIDHIIWYIHTHLCCLTFAWVFANFFLAKPVAHSSTSKSMTIISKKWEKYKMLKKYEIKVGDHSKQCKSLRIYDSTVQWLFELFGWNAFNFWVLISFLYSISGTWIP